MVKPVKNQLSTISKEIKRSVTDGLSARAMRRIGQFMLVLITERTRRGKGVRRVGGPQVPLRRLSRSYVAQRRKSRLLDSTTTPGKSNLTFTGIMLRSMTVIRAENFQVSVGPNRRTRRGGLTNQELGEIVSRVRPFNNLSKRELERVAEFTDDEIQKAINRNKVL